MSKRWVFARNTLSVVWDLARSGNFRQAVVVLRTYLLPGLVVSTLLAAEVAALALLWRWLRLRAAQGDLETAIYYTLSTVAQTTAAMSGLLLAFVALRLPSVLKEAENDQVPTDLKPLVKVLVEARILAYKLERTAIIGRTVLALITSFVAIAGSLVGLALTPWFDPTEQAGLLKLIVGLALVALHAQAWMLWPSLRAMRAEARGWWGR